MPGLPHMGNPFKFIGDAMGYAWRDPEPTGRVKMGQPEFKPYSGLGLRSFLKDTGAMFDPRTREGAVNLLGMALPGPKGGKARPMTRAQMDAMAKTGELAGGAVTVKKMSPAQMAAAKAEREAKAGHNTADIVTQHGSKGLLLRHGNDGALNLLNLAKHPGHSNTSYHASPTDVFGQPAAMRPTREEASRAAFIVDESGHITVGAPGTHHDQIMRAKGIEGRAENVIQGEIHFEQQIPDVGHIPARLFTGREWAAEGGIGSGGMFGPGKPNHLQTAALEDWLNKANGLRSVEPMSGKPTTPRVNTPMGKSPAEMGDIKRANALRRKLAGEPNPLGKPSPTALQIAGRANPQARSEAARLAGHPDNRGKDFETKRVRLGVEEGGYIARPPERVIVPSKTTSADKERFIPRGLVDKRTIKRPDRMH